MERCHHWDETQIETKNLIKMCNEALKFSSVNDSKVINTEKIQIVNLHTAPSKRNWSKSSKKYFQGKKFKLVFQKFIW